MYGKSSEEVGRVVHGLCEVADASETALLIECEVGDAMMPRWDAEGFVAVNARWLRTQGIDDALIQPYSVDASRAGPSAKLRRSTTKVIDRSPV